MKKKHVSIFVVSYNHAEFVELCLNSIKCQLNVSYDLTVIDNGSIDGTSDIIRQLNVTQDFKFIENNTNLGLPATLNMCLDMALGEYICFIAADDYMAINRLFVQVQFLEEHHEFYACSGTQLKVDDNNNLCDIKKQKNIIKNFIVIDKNNIFDRTNIIYSPTSIYRTQALKDIGGYRTDIAIEDLYIYYKAAEKNYKIAVLPNLFSFYRIHPGNSHSKLKWMHENKLKILREFKNAPFYEKLKDLIYLEGFYSLSSKHKLAALKIIPTIMHRIDSKYLYAGIFKLLFKW
ncbi:glycosyltransferase family 2 protein [Enterobacter roggenkampii]|uniref:glycosyltransferase family 2 protein n=1 Tax=Enterobacter roggenkampii TaxID=1812935 RepID=UPI002003D413|nr:glycosyltransferase [Enterobacter roggenkampii]MCK7011762.1 glycosyltransferase [Enterobacter roggenkampii]MCK7026660.1 glycosyltransferase [Enterobacter roggenkampii]